MGPAQFWRMFQEGSGLRSWRGEAWQEGLRGQDSRGSGLRELEGGNLGEGRGLR